MNTIVLDLQIASNHPHIPTEALCTSWLKLAAKELDLLEPSSQPDKTVELTVRIVDIPEMTALNEQYRHKPGPTNVLSFPFEAMDFGLLELGESLDPTESSVPLLGDIVICAPIIEEEALSQQKAVMAHWAHMVVHGFLHLLGYDHIETAEALVMESLEVQILTQLGFSDPYGEYGTYER